MISSLVVFKSGFAEASFSTLSTDTSHGGSIDANETTEVSQGSGLTMRQFEDSDDEDEDEDDMMVDTDSDLAPANSSVPASVEARPASRSVEDNSSDTLSSWQSDIGEYGQPQLYDQPRQGEDPNTEELRNVRPKLSHPSTPRSVSSMLEQDARDSAPIPPAAGPAKTHVVIRDAAYATYRAVLYYVRKPNSLLDRDHRTHFINSFSQIYTDTIALAPLSSTFMASSATTPKMVASVPATPTSESQAPAFSQRPNHQQAERSTTIGSATPRSRREWIAQWERNNVTGRPRPCSAKAVYRLADKLDLQELKQRAFQHIVKSLTVGNVAYEVFSTFSAAFEDVRKVTKLFTVRRSIAGILTQARFCARSHAGPKLSGFARGQCTRARPDFRSTGILVDTRETASLRSHFAIHLRRLRSVGISLTYGIVTVNVMTLAITEVAARVARPPRGRCLPRG
ncbi:hypothetical protein EVJ58_g6485 [Rhodofomes roseus]|uniref:Uncharacterized protein n=1 Tax=Rhodofomes roseus TaxID=34475 RepID=A0A4Y9Y746_9APHY|nr:hypothetical protein EVJ58_g6485 [Rhodofomes roseus]